MARYRDLSTQKFGKLTPIEYRGMQGKQSYWLCKCDCGNEVTIRTSTLLNGNTKSCGCAQYTKKSHINEQYGQWTIIGDLGYKSGLHYVRCRCSCGTEQDIHYSTLKTGRTKSCGHDYNKLIDLTNQRFGDWTVVSRAASNTSTTLWNCVCTCGKTAVISSQSLRNGESKSCGHRVIIDLLGKTFGDWLVTDHTFLENGAQYCECTCSCGATKTIYVHNLLQGKTLSCGHNTSQSRVEQELAQYISSLGLEIIRNDRQQLGGKELDIYVPDKHVAIEYNGSYWHSDVYKDKNYHLFKTATCAKNFIDLIHIFEYEWMNPEKQSKLKELLKAKFNIDQKIIYARDTKVQYVKDLAQLKEFLEKYHLQGYVQSQEALGLYYNDELLEVMTFGKPRFNKRYDIELLRLCTKHGYKVVGGAAKLLTHYATQHKGQKLITYCDLSKFTGRVYEQLGMKQIQITSPNYVYVKEINDAFEVKTRYQCQKHKLVKAGLEQYGSTEYEIMTNLGYMRVYDCGNVVYSYML